MLSLLLSLETHMDSLIKVLNATHVTKDTLMDQFDGVVACITIGNFLGLVMMSCLLKEGLIIKRYISL